MRIIDRNHLAATASEGTSGAEATGGRSVDRARLERSPEHDRSELSPLAQPLAETITGQSTERVVRIEELRAAVASGTYQSDAQAVSGKIVAEALATWSRE